MKYTLLTFLGLALLLNACSNDNQEEFYDAAECDTTNVTFSATVDPIIDRNCKSCHGAGNGTGVTLVTYSDIKKHVDNGSLIGSIKHEPGFSAMPLGGKLDDCTIAKLDAWIAAGAQDN